jgi:hypothetical protein
MSQQSEKAAAAGAQDLLKADVAWMRKAAAGRERLDAAARREWKAAAVQAQKKLIVGRGGKREGSCAAAEELAALLYLP